MLIWAQEVYGSLVTRKRTRTRETYVELSTTKVVGVVESNQLSLEKVVSVLDALRHLESVPATAADHVVDGVEPILANLEPLEAVGVLGGSIANLGPVRNDIRKRTLFRSGCCSSTYI